MNFVFLFPGQGAQYNGMGKALYDNFSVVRDVFAQADDVLGFSLSKLCFSDDAALHDTENTQVAILTLSMAVARLLREHGIVSCCNVGLSLGEYSALTDAGAFRFADAVSLVRTRGELMANAIPPGISSMYALMGASASDVLAFCAEAGRLGVVSPANFNTQNQIVIAGENAAVEEAVRLAALKGVKRAIKLNVSGAFHTALLADAAEKLNTVLSRVPIAAFEKPVLSNVTGGFYKDSGDCVPLLTKQIMSPVKFFDCVNAVSEKQRVDYFIEVGPGKVLSGFVKKIVNDAAILHVEDIKSLEHTLAKNL